MKRYLYLLPVLLFTKFAFAQEVKKPKEIEPTTDKTIIVPAETIASCQLATQKLGNNVIKDNYAYVLEKMYSRYFKRQAVRYGEKKFRQSVLNTPKTLNTMGAIITSFKAEQPICFFHVWPQIKPTAKLKLERGEQKKLKAGDVFNNWLIIVPTTQVWKFTSNKGGPPRELKRVGFQVAIAQETAVPGKEVWTFIDGTSMTSQELRSVFPSLPQKMILPLRKNSEIK